MAASCLLFLQKMASRRSNEQFQGHVSTCHLLYQILVDMPANVVTNFTNKLGWLYNREFAISLRIDWVKLGEVGLTERMAPFLSKLFVWTILLSPVMGGGVCLPLVSPFSKSYVWSYLLPSLLKMPRSIHLTHGPWW